MLETCGGMQCCTTWRQRGTAGTRRAMQCGTVGTRWGCSLEALGVQKGCRGHSRAVGMQASTFWRQRGAVQAQQDTVGHGSSSLAPAAGAAVHLSLHVPTTVPLSASQPCPPAQGWRSGCCSAWRSRGCCVSPPGCACAAGGNGRDVAGWHRSLLRSVPVMCFRTLWSHFQKSISSFSGRI